jgi:DNA-binding TFAR19-related protein (PDSD5 family)
MTALWRKLQAHQFFQKVLPECNAQDELRSINLDHPDTQKAIEEINVILKSTGRPTG